MVKSIRSLSLKSELKVVVMMKFDLEGRSITFDILFLFVLQPILNSY